LGSHPRIVTYTVKILSLSSSFCSTSKGDLDSYLQRHPEFLFEIASPYEIAQGIAYLHSKDVVWNDTHLGNVLVTDGLHVVLCDIGGSYVKLDRLKDFDTVPPVPNVWPQRLTIKHFWF
jgi:serine/threonine protein kinase